MIMANYATTTSNMMDRRCTTTSTSTLRSPPGTSGLRSPPDRKEWTVCSLQEGCLSLDQILKSFSAPISEEHAWAVIHQVGLHVFNYVSVDNLLSHIYIKKTSDIQISQKKSVVMKCSVT